MSEMNEGFFTGGAAVIGPQTEALLASGQQVTFQISGDSMRPTLKPRRDAVLLDGSVPWPPEKGDILFYRTPKTQSGYAIHRVRRVTPEGPIMNGDAQGWVEGPIPREQVFGRAVVLFRGGEPLDIGKPAYRLYVRLWWFTRPLRKPMFAIWRGIKRLLGRK